MRTLDAAPQRPPGGERPTNGSERWEERGVLRRVLVHVFTVHPSTGFVMPLFHVGGDRWPARGGGKRSVPEERCALDSAHDLRTVPELVALLLGAATFSARNQGRSIFGRPSSVPRSPATGRPPRLHHQRGEPP
ncbi:DUF6126 family protein [Streptomyces sp. NPDC014623]|uniref:DUF6126 family protein n=1 Tax=Streptomyces sp. NPDC014623 TaxID=3364875 RepID=UPI003702F4AE